MQKVFLVQPVETLWDPDPGPPAVEPNLLAGASGSSSERLTQGYHFDRVRLLVDLNNVDNDVYLEGFFVDTWHELWRQALSAATSRNLSAIVEAPFGSKVRFTKSGVAGSVLIVRMQPILSRVTAFGGSV